MSERIGVSELIGMARAGGSLKDGTFKVAVLGAIGMAGASGRESYRLGDELHRLRCAQQAERWEYAMAIFRKQARGIAKKDRWRKVSGDQVERLCEHCLKEWLFDLCIPCGGRGKVFGGVEITEVAEREVLVKCESCGGSGNGGAMVQERMRVLGIGVEEYMKHWEARFDTLIAVLHKAYGVAQRSVAKRMGRKVEDA